MSESIYQSLALAAGGGGFYLTGEDNFRLTSWGAVANAVITLEGRYVDCDGRTVPFVETHTPNSDRSAATSIFPAREGLLLNLQTRMSTGTATPGAAAVLLEIQRGREGAITRLGTLLQGYVTSATRLAWPGAPSGSLVGAVSRQRIVLGTDPAAGVEIAETVPTNTRWKLRAIAYTFVTSAAVANRTPILTIDDGANILWEAGHNANVTASTTAKFRAGAGVPLATITANVFQIALPGELWLPAGARIRTVTGALDAGDNYGAPVYQVEELFDL